MQAIQDAERIAALMEEKFCKDEGYVQQISSVEKLKLPEHHAIIEADALADNVEDVDDFGVQVKLDLDPKMRRRMKKAEDALKDKTLVKQLKTKKKQKTPVKKLQVLIHKGRQKMQNMLKTMTRLEALKSTLVEAGKGKAKTEALKAAAKGANEMSEELKQQKLQIKHLKKVLNKKFLKVTKKKLKKLKPSLKSKPSAKTKPSLKSKDSAVVKAAVKAILKEKKNAMKKTPQAYAKKWSAVKKNIKKNYWKSKLLYIAGFFCLISVGSMLCRGCCKTL